MYSGSDAAANKITRIEGLDSLVKLEWLSLRGNQIEQIGRLYNLISLSTLYLSNVCQN